MTTNEIRKQLRKMLPPETFEPQPDRGVVALLVAALSFVLIAVLYLAQAPWYLVIPASIIIGQMWTHTGLAAHEALHGAIFRSKFWQEVLGYVGLGPYLLGCETWCAWHVRSHHAATNNPDLDPDMVGPFCSYKSNPVVRVLDLITIGSKRLFSPLSLMMQFTMQGQLILWYHSLRDVKFKAVRFNRRKAMGETLVIVGIFAAAIAVMGWWYGLWLLILPTLFANATFMSYICTQHFIRPLTQENDPLVNAMSVKSHWLVDKLHLEFSYHREHHLFPNMSHRFGPRVRAALIQLGVPAEPTFTHLQALKMVLSTPRMYASSHVLRSANGEQVDLREFWREHNAREAELVESVPEMPVTVRAAG